MRPSRLLTYQDHGVSDSREARTLGLPAKSSPGFETFAKGCTMVGVVINGVHCVQRSLVHNTVLLSLEFRGPVCSAGPLVQDISILWKLFSTI